MQKVSKNKKIVFNEKIDDSISSFALVIAFILIGILLQFDNSFFGSGTTIIKLSFILIGILGLFTEIIKLNKTFSIKGLGNIGVGCFLIVFFYLLKIYINVDKLHEVFNILFQTFLFFLILISTYGFCRGLIEMIYSLYKNYKDKSTVHKKGNLFSSIMIVLTQLLGLLLILAQIYDIFK